LRAARIGETFPRYDEDDEDFAPSLHLPYHGPALRTVACLIEENLACHPSPNAKLEGLEGEWGPDIAQSWAALHNLKEQLEAAADRVDAALESADC